MIDQKEGDKIFTMEKVVQHGLKFDLHIHSCMSSVKDGNKVKNNSLDNIPLLIRKLNEQEVNMCAITDHDAFSYDMYAALKKAEQEDNTILKVFPGVEFSVCFVGDGSEKVIHVVAVFSDEEDSKIRLIEDILKQNPPTHQQSYKEEDFLALLRAININTILIAHQKNTLSSKQTRKNDANTLGEAKFLEFIYTDYFEAFEFKNRRNEVLNKNYLLQKHMLNQVRFVTGTDCHDWTAYPSESAAEHIENFPYTFAKCLPTFRGLVMAITDNSRMKTVDSFFSASNCALSSLQIVYGEQTSNIPLSKGINVIIGDNSVGKSLLLHALTGYSKPGLSLPASVKSGYQKYLSNLGLSIPKQIKQDQIFCFDMQGEVRKKFEENKLNITEFLGSYFPPPVDNSPYKAILSNEISKMINHLRNRFDLDRKIKALSSFGIEIIDVNAESLTFVNNIGYSKEKSGRYSNVATQIDTILAQIRALFNLSIDDEDRETINSIISTFSLMWRKYTDLEAAIEVENSRKEVVSSVIRKASASHKKSASDSQKKQSAFTESTADFKEKLIDIIRASRNISKYTPSIEKTIVNINSNRVSDYEFISKLQIEEIGTDYFFSVISRVLKANQKIDFDSITEKELQDKLLRYDDTPVLEFLGNAMMAIIEADLAPKNSIIFQGMDKYAELSSGLDAKIYFDLLAYETLQDGIYIIDQPEDNISQSSIREYLLDNFKTMGENRQIIMVTHNPQFIVNLDVDNLIFLSKKDGVLVIQSGALEYACPEYNILDIVANNIDGGLDSIRKRWKRYEKTTEI